MGYQRAIWWTLLCAVAIMAGAPTFIAQSALAQSWLPWTTREDPPPRRQPQQQQQPAPNYGQSGQQPYGSQGGYGDRAPICLQLEQRLALDAQRNANSQGTIQKLREDLNVERRRQRRTEIELERRECYESFLFTRSLRPSRTCHKLDDESRQAEQRVRELT
ncbi:MAG: hypothetical protein KKB37_14935, partial [Alphaproteobacteria bacterium]|nr:hypothetical protein [Alphaproteobacteria bacterium]